MEQNTRFALMNALDKNLLDHAAALAGAGGLTIDGIYRLWALTEQHYYLKVEHQFSAGEMEALLDFTDPLEVARVCWEDADHEKPYSICEMLRQTNAYEVYPLKDPAAYEQKKEEVLQRLYDALDKGLADARAHFLGLEKEQIFDAAGRINGLFVAHDYLRTSYAYGHDEADTLLQLDDPLAYMADNWPSLSPELDSEDLDECIRDIIATAKEGLYKRRMEARAEPSATQKDKPSIVGQLRSAAAEATGKEPPPDRPRGGDAR